MTPTKLPPSPIANPQTGPSNSRLNLRQLTVLSVLVLILLAAAVLWALQARKTSPGYKVHYSQFTDEALAGAGGSSAMSFPRPTDFSVLAPGNVGYVSYFGQIRYQLRTYSTVGGEVAYSSPSPSVTYAADTAKAFSSAVSADSYKAAVEPANRFLGQVIGYLYFAGSLDSFSLSLDPAAKTSDSGLANAWIIPFKAVSKTAANQTGNPIQGELLLAIGKSNYYYLMLSATDANWGANHSTWEQIFKSVKIDQAKANPSAVTLLPSAKAKLTDNTCFDGYNQAFVHYGDCTAVELQSQAYITGPGCYNGDGDFLIAGACNGQ